MTTRLPARRAVPLVLLGLASALLIGVGVDRSACLRARAEVVDQSTSGVQTILFEGVEVDIPATWEALDMGDCEFHFERWGPQGTPPCEPDAVGVAFYGSATFDPELGPGVVRNGGRDQGLADWEGWVDAGDYVVYASDADRAAVTAILDSVRRVECGMAEQRPNDWTPCRN